MAKRFGRNQRRKMQERIKAVETKAHQHAHEQAIEISRLRQKLSQAIVIDVDVLQDNARFAYEARVSAHKRGHDSWYVAQLIADRDLAMTRERDRFIAHVSDMMANRLARAIGEKWGSGRNPFADYPRAHLETNP